MKCALSLRGQDVRDTLTSVVRAPVVFTPSMFGVNGTILGVCTLVRVLPLLRPRHSERVGGVGGAVSGCWQRLPFLPLRRAPRRGVGTGPSPSAVPAPRAPRRGSTTGQHPPSQGARAPAIRCWRRPCPALSTWARGCGCCLQVSPVRLEEQRVSRLPLAAPASKRGTLPFCLQESGGDTSSQHVSLPSPRACSLAEPVGSEWVGGLLSPGEGGGQGGLSEHRTLFQAAAPQVVLGSRRGSGPRPHVTFNDVLPLSLKSVCSAFPRTTDALASSALSALMTGSLIL